MKKEKSSPFVSTVSLKTFEKLCSIYTICYEHKVDTSSLSVKLECSIRNVPKIMKKMSEKGWLHWVSGKGRGNKSVLKILTGFEGALDETLKHLCTKGRLSDAADLASRFDYLDTFYGNLAHYLIDNSESSKNTLLSLVPYTLPELHPLKVQYARSKLYIESMFDTLLKYDQSSGQIRPHLAHHYEYRGNELWLRIRPDIYFHNGERLTPTHIEVCIKNRIEANDILSLLYRHIKDVTSNSNWVILHMSHLDPTILHLLAELSSSIYLERRDDSSPPYGTGPFKLESFSSTNWTLASNTHYFSERPIISRAEFWSIDAHKVPEDKFIVHNGTFNKDIDKGVVFPLNSGCESLEFNCFENGLTLEERAWIMQNVRVFCEQTASDLFPVANSVTSYHQDKVFNLPPVECKLPQRSVRFVSPKEKEVKRIALIQYLKKQGLNIKEVSLADRNVGEFDVDITGYVPQDDLFFSYYKWLLCSETIEYSVPENIKTRLVSFIDTLLLKCCDRNDLLAQLYRCEDWLIQNCISMPLWREHNSYQISDNVKGTYPDNAGGIPLTRVWISNS